MFFLDEKDKFVESLLVVEKMVERTVEGEARDGYHSN